MPIRFRCAYCNQLMGIARRKAGTVVSCPKCAGQVVVPQPGPGDDDAEPSPVHAPQPAPEGGLFEQSDFGKIFDAGPNPHLLNPSPQPRPAVKNPAPLPDPALGEFDAIPLGPEVGSTARGVFLTSGVLAVICALVVVLMGLAFFLGLLLGKSSQP